MDWSIRTYSFGAITSCILLSVYSNAAFGQDPQGSIRSIDQPWMIECESRSCVSLEQAAGAFFRHVLMMNDSFPPGGMARSAFKLSQASWDLLVAHARAWAEDDLSYQLKLSKGLCSQASTITTRAQLAAALDDNDRLAEQRRLTYVDSLDSFLTPAELESVIQEIDDRRNSLAWASIDWAMYFEMQNVDPTSILTRLCEKLIKSVALANSASVIILASARMPPYARFQVSSNVRQHIKLVTKPTLTKKQAILGVAVGLVLGFIVAAIMTTLDWRRNPGSIFHNALGTDWGIVGETAFSWFLPVALAGTVVTAILLFLVSRLK